MVTGVVSSSPRVLPSICIANRVQQSNCSSTFHRVLLTHALALSASPFVHKKKSPRIYTRLHSGGFELTTQTYTRLDNLIRHRGDRHYHVYIISRGILAYSYSLVFAKADNNVVIMLEQTVGVPNKAISPYKAVPPYKAVKISWCDRGCALTTFNE